MRHASILLVLAAATSARADGDHTLHLAVHGSVDSAAVGAALAKELGVEVAVADGTCELPCLDVTVDGRGPPTGSAAEWRRGSIDGQNTATIMFSPRSGAPRARAVTLGTDTAQWPLVITLLAGNVVRDEAQDVLAGLPARELTAPAAPDTTVEVPPAPEDVAPPPPPVVAAPPVAAPEPPGEHRWLGLGFVPGLSTDLTHVGSVRHFLSIDVLVGVSGGSSGLSLSGIADIERGMVAGFQVGGVLATARRVAGTQVAGVVAVAGNVDGVQLAGTAAVADLVEGFQVAGIASVSRTSADTQAAGIATFARGSSSTQVAGIAAASGQDAGLQLAGIASYAHHDAGVQGAGIAAVSGHDAHIQAAGIASVARGTADVQIAGVVNVASRLRGLQIAPINVARSGAGTQVGVINVGGDPDGFSFGLINIVPGGRYDLETAIDTDKIGTLLFRHGGRRWHNVYGVAGRSTDESATRLLTRDTHATGTDDVWMYGLGFGPSISFGNTVIDLEAMGWEVNHGARHEENISVLGQLRLSVAHHWGPFAIVAGGLLNAYVTDDQKSPLMIERRIDGGGGPMDTRTSLTVWPSAFVGVRI
ncbi:MAG: hypothetical protein ABIY55_06095 [Kofleriaceae bacterium]